MTLTQTPAICPECARSDKHAPGRYCLAICLCRHETCPAYATSPPKPDPYARVVPITKEAA